MSINELEDFESTYLFGSRTRRGDSKPIDTLREILGERTNSTESKDSLNLSDAEKEADEFLNELNKKDKSKRNEETSSVTVGNKDQVKHGNQENFRSDEPMHTMETSALSPDINDNVLALKGIENRSGDVSNDISMATNGRVLRSTDSSDIRNHNRIIDNMNDIRIDNDNSISSLANIKTRNHNSISNKREIRKQLSNTAAQSDERGNFNALQQRYSRAIEDFKVFRSNLTENMERNLLRTEHLGLQNKKGEQYRSYDNILRNNFEFSSRTQSDVALRNKNPQRYNSQERLYKLSSDMNLEERLGDDCLRHSPRTARRMLTNNNFEMRGQSLPRGSNDFPFTSEQQREHQSQLRDQAAKSNFERYLRGSVIMHQNTFDSSASLSMSTNSTLEDPDVGYGGSGSTSPRDMDNVMMPSDQLSSRSGSINSRHSRSSSVMASVDSGVRMSYVGQHNSLVVVAIDFGTTFSGYAFSFTRDSNSIHMMRRWEGGDPGVTNQKTPTSLLLKPDGSFHSFGFGARDFYHDLDAGEAKKWLYFDKFKMSLHSSEDLHAGIEIKAANGKVYPALKVFSHVLRYFKQHVLGELSDQSTAKLGEEDITWVLTVPAIWRQPAKQFMRTAAYEAGITSINTPDRLLIALEPEAASIFCRKLRIRDCVIADDLKAKVGDDTLISEDFEGVTQYVVVDCGGGTVDLTVHELDVTQGTLKELHKGTGGPCGATGVDKEFEKLLKRIFDNYFIERFKVKRPAAWIDLMISFEAKKRAAKPNNQSPLNISLPFVFIEYHKKHRKCTVETAVKKFKNPDIKWSSQGMLRFSANIIQTLFEPVVNDVIGHIQNLLTKGTLKHVEYLFLVGGFAESPLLQYSIREALEGRVRVIIPNDVGLAILKGAVLFGLDPTVVRVRRSAYTYGVGVLNKFDPEKHEQSKRVVKDGIVWCKDIFDRFVRVDESVGVGDRVTRSYAPARSKQKSTVINIYCTEKLDVLYTTDKGVTRCGKLRIEMPDVNPEDIPTEKRGKPRELQASMIFGDTEIKVSAVDVLSGRAARAAIDFLNY